MRSQLLTTVSGARLPLMSLLDAAPWMPPSGAFGYTSTSSLLPPLILTASKALPPSSIFLHSTYSKGHSLPKENQSANTKLSNIYAWWRRSLPVCGPKTHAWMQ
eukprot:2943885-Ditylum_brightwellii.AAC.1